MEIEKLQSLSDEILDELLIVWEKSVRSSHHFLKEEDIEAQFMKNSCQIR